MELSALWGTLRRRWYLLVVSLGLTVAATVLMAGRVGPSYTVEGTMLLFPPAETSNPSAGGNPYLALGGLEPARDILIRTMSSKTAREELAEVHPGATYELVADAAVSGPIIVIQVSGTSNDEAVDALASVAEMVPQTLAQLQKARGIEASESITVQPLTADPNAELVRTGQIRSGIVTGVGTLVACLLGIGLLDGLLLSRRSRQRGSAGGPEAGTGLDADDRELRPVGRLGLAADPGEDRPAESPAGTDRAGQPTQTPKNPPSKSRPRTDRTGKNRSGKKTPAQDRTDDDVPATARR
jgi:hypothetical protein